MTERYQLNWQGWDKASQSYPVIFNCQDKELIGKEAQLYVVTTATPFTKPEFVSTDERFKAAGNDLEIKPEEFIRYKKKFVIGEQVKLELSTKKIKGFNYEGQFLHLKNTIRVVMNKQLLAEIPIQNGSESQIFRKTECLTKRSSDKDAFSDEYTKSKDKTNVFLIWQALDPRLKFQMLAVPLLYFFSLGVSLVLLKNAYYGEAHWILEENEAVSMVIFYVMLSVAIIPLMGLWFKNMLLSPNTSLKLKTLSSRLSRASQLNPSNLFQGKSEVDLKNITLQIVAVQVEKYPYAYGELEFEDEDNSDDVPETYVREERTRYLKLYSKTIELIPKNQLIQSFFKDDINLEQLFDELYPPSFCSKTTGIDLHLDIQLISPYLADIKKTMKGLKFEEKDFFH